MLKLNKKGQASSTFQLLIAAIVALAILGVLISIITGVITPQGNPTSATKQLVKSQMDNPGGESCTEQQVRFSRNIRLASMGIVEDTGLSPNQLLFINPYGVALFTPEEGGASPLLSYDSRNVKNVYMCVICAEYHTDAIDYMESIADNFDEGANTALDMGDNDLTNDMLCIAYPKT